MTASIATKSGFMATILSAAAFMSVPAQAESLAAHPAWRGVSSFAALPGAALPERLRPADLSRLESAAGLRFDGRRAESTVTPYPAWETGYDERTDALLRIAAKRAQALARRGYPGRDGAR